jgi:hypothetical protein
MTAPLSNFATWIMTGNNVSADGDILRRVAWIRLQSPERTKQYRHPDLIGWVKKSRHKLIWAILTVIQYWIVQGITMGSKILPSFESWSKVMGGIFDSVGINGFLANHNELVEYADQTGLMWEQFVTVWWKKFGGRRVLPKQLWELALSNDMLLDVLGDGNERSQRIRLGKELQRQKDRPYGEYQICSKRDTFRKTMVYWLNLMENAT